jgi:hypothetical protein
VKNKETDLASPVKVEETAQMIAVEEANSRAWRVDVELSQICSSRPCCSRCGDRDTVATSEEVWINPDTRL